ncbi:MAG: hypothetical protein U0T83_03235 [Bacteriovoracaceae bacterium]
MKNINLSLLVITQLLFFNESIIAKPLSEKQITQRVLCKHKQTEYKMSEANLAVCMAGKYEIARFAECSKMDEQLYDACLKSKLSFENRVACDSFNKKITLNFNWVDEGCMEAKAISTNLCLQKLENYGLSMARNNQEFHLTGSAGNPGGYWSGLVNFKEFIKSCYSSEPQVFNLCDGLYKGKSINSFEKCINAKPTTTVISKCNTILNNPKDPDEMLYCFDEFHAVKVTSETPEKVKASLNNQKKNGLEKIHDGNRVKKNGVIVKRPAKKDSTVKDQ